MDFTIKNKAFFILIATVLFYVIMVLSSDISKILSHLSLINPYYLIATFPLLLFSIFIRGFRYQIILREIKINLGFIDSVSIFLAGMSMLVTPGGMGTIIKSYILKKKTGNSYSSTVPIIIYEKWLEVLSNTLLIAILLIWFDLLEAKIVLGIGIIFSVLMFLFLKNPNMLKYFNKFIYKIVFMRKFVLDFEKFRNSAHHLINFKVLLKTLPLTIAAQIPVFISVFLIFQSFNLNFNIISTSQIYLTSISMGLFTMIPGGLIVTEAGLLGILIQNNVEFSIASSLVLIIRLINFWFVILVGFVVLKLIFQSKTNFKNMK